MKKYYALIFDIVKSRNYLQREELQIRLKKIISYLNIVYNKYLEKEVICQSGDEFQGLFNDGTAAFNYIRQFSLLAYPIKIRSAIGIGDVDYLVSEWVSAEINGETYYNARLAMNRLPKSDENLIFVYSNTNNDFIINTINITNNILKNEQTEICHFLELLIELNYPLIDYMPLYNKNIYKELTDIIKNNKDLPKKKENKNDQNKKLKLDYKTIIDYKEFEILLEKPKDKKENDNKNIYIEGDIPYGLLTSISQLFNKTPQNISKHINGGHLSEIRANEKLISSLIEKI